MKIETRNGKKIVFINPPELIKGVVIETLIGKGFEVYILNDHNLISSIAKAYSSTLFFIYLDVGMPLNEWEMFIEELVVNQPYINIGVLSFNRNFNKELVDKLLYQLNINCGYIQLDHDLDEVTRILLTVLKANEANGRNRILKYSLPENGRNTVNYSLNGKIYKDKIVEISSIGFSSVSNNSIALKKNQILRDTQLFINGVVIHTDLIAVGNVYSDRIEKQIFVYLNSSFRFQQTREKVQKLLYKGLQAQFDREFGLIKQTVSNREPIYN